MSETDQTFLEQRRSVRLDVERIGHPRCRMAIAPDLTLDLLLTDISPGGFGATVFVSQIRHFQKQREFQHCHIALPGLEDFTVRVVYLWHLRGDTGETTRVGFEFLSPIAWEQSGLTVAVPQ